MCVYIYIYICANISTHFHLLGSSAQRLQEFQRSVTAIVDQCSDPVIRERLRERFEANAESLNVQCEVRERCECCGQCDVFEVREATNSKHTPERKCKRHFQHLFYCQYMFAFWQIFTTV